MGALDGYPSRIMFATLFANLLDCCISILIITERLSSILFIRRPRTISDITLFKFHLLSKTGNIRESPIRLIVLRNNHRDSS